MDAIFFAQHTGREWRVYRKVSFGGAVCGKERPELWTQDKHKSDLFFSKEL